MHFISACLLFFADNKLIDLAGDFVKRGGKYLFIDEIHKYQDWAKEPYLIKEANPRY